MAILSPTDICNQALGLLGQQAIIDISDQTPVGAFCRLHYYQTRDAMLQGFRWNFAIKREALSLHTEVPLSGFDFYYALPSDNLRVLEINDLDWKFCGETYGVEGNKLATDDFAPILKYISRVEDTSLFTPLFIDALATKLGSKLCVPLKGSADLAQALLAQYERYTKQDARLADAFEQNPYLIPQYVDSRLVRSRGFGYGSDTFGTRFA